MGTPRRVLLYWREDDAQPVLCSNVGGSYVRPGYATNEEEGHVERRGPRLRC